MDDELKVVMYEMVEGGVTMAVKIPNAAMAMSEYTAREVLDKVVRLVAERYVAENYSALVANLDQRAISNLAIAESGRKIAEEIKNRPVVYREKGDTTTNFSIF